MQANDQDSMLKAVDEYEEQIAKCLRLSSKGNVYRIPTLFGMYSDAKDQGEYVVALLSILIMEYERAKKYQQANVLFFRELKKLKRNMTRHGA